MHCVNIIVLLIGSVLSTDIGIIQQPDSAVFQGSTQTITWRTNMTLSEVSIDLYKHSKFVANIGQTKKDVRTFAWKVSKTATCGSDYFLKISLVTSTKSKFWINTQTFDIVDNFNLMDLLWLLLLLICFVPYCAKKMNCSCGNDNYKEPFLPTAVPVQPGTEPPTLNRYPTYSQPVYTTNPISTSNNTRSVAGGFALGVAADELFHHSHNHSSFFDNNSNNFGGGDFGVSDFGGNGGDSSFS
tara:strand:+ start:481 stop:1206 length:726 start_codon:yes stop_codon:yes gene_type:complete